MPKCAQLEEGAQERFLRLRRQGQGIIAGGVGVEPLFPELIQLTTGMDAAQSQEKQKERDAHFYGYVYAYH
jgi:hypothetical protein